MQITFMIYLSNVNKLISTVSMRRISTAQRGFINNADWIQQQNHPVFSQAFDGEGLAASDLK
jgi:hypothetical protein